MARVTLRPLRPRDVPIVRRLVQLYIYDLVGQRWGVERDGTYGSADASGAATIATISSSG